LKKIIGIFVILLFTINLFGSVIDDIFTNESMYITIGSILRINNITDPTKNHWGREIYCFTANEKTYIISYEQCEDCKKIKKGETKFRKIYLYRWDSIDWKIAIDKPLRNDTNSYDENWNRTCNCYFPLMYGSNICGFKLFDSKYDGCINILNNGNIEIKLTIYIKNSAQMNDFIFNSEIITLKPDGNNYIIIDKNNDKSISIYRNNRN